MSSNHSDVSLVLAAKCSNLVETACKEHSYETALGREQGGASWTFGPLDLWTL